MGGSSRPGPQPGDSGFGSAPSQSACTRFTEGAWISLPPPGKKPWTQIFMRWLNGVQLDYEDDRHVLRTNLAQIAFLEAQIREHDVQIACMAEQSRFKTQVEILQGFRGIALFTAMQLVCELGDIRRFGHPTALMAYLGLVPSQRSSGATIRYGGITKTGNVHARKALVSAA